jgi:acyl-CoA thioester hydrolase
VTAGSPVPFTHPIDVRYLEVDQQGVVFNMWYLAYFDEAMTAFLAQGGTPYDVLTEAGYDAQIVHTELDWSGSLGWGDRAEVDVSLASIGRTSFALDFRTRVGEREVVSARTVYVVIATDGSGAREVPDLLRKALGPVAPFRPDPSP